MLIKKVLLFCCATVFVSTATVLEVPLEIRHLKMYTGVSTGDNDGVVGRYSRGNPDHPYKDYSDEIIMRGDLSSITGKDAIINSAKVIVTVAGHLPVNLNFPTGTVSLFEQNKGLFSMGATYSTFDNGAWGNALGQVTAAAGGDKEFSSELLKGLVSAWCSGAKVNNGFAVGGNFSDWNFAWKVSKAKIVIDYKINEAPTASSVSISGEVVEKKELVGSYLYADLENDLEAVSLYQWYRASTINGADRAPIMGANALTYLVTLDDVGKYLSFAVKPRAKTGALAGVEFSSGWVGPVKLSEELQTVKIKQGPQGDWIHLKRTADAGYWRVHNPASQDRVEFGYTDSTGKDNWGLLNIHNT